MPTLDNAWVSTSTTQSITVASNANRVLYVVVNADANASGVTANGVALTSVDTTSYFVWRLIAPDTGTYNVVVTGATNFYTAGVYSVYDADQATGHRAIAQFSGGSASSWSNSVTSESGDLCIDFTGSGSSSGNPPVTMTPNAGQSAALFVSAAYVTSFADTASTETATGTSTTMGWAASPTATFGWIHCLIAVKPAAIPTGTTLGLVIGSATAFVGEGFIGSIEAVSGPTYTQSLSASLTPAAAIVRDPRKPLAASLTSTAALVKQTAKRVSGSLTAAAATIKRTDKPLGGSITGTTTVSGARAILRALSASLTPAATVTRLTSKSLGASLTAAATARKETRKTLAAALTATATVTKRTARALTATLTAAATVTKRTARSLGASLTPAAALAKQTAKTLGAVLTPATSLLTTLLGGAARGLVTAILTLRNVAAALTARPVDASLTARAPRADLTQRAEAVTTLTAQTGVDTALTTRAPDADLTARPSVDGVLQLESDDPVS